jgi:hypothetical protein
MLKSEVAVRRMVKLFAAASCSLKPAWLYCTADSDACANRSDEYAHFPRNALNETNEYRPLEVRPAMIDCRLPNTALQLLRKMSRAITTSVLEVDASQQPLCRACTPTFEQVYDA